MIEPFLSDPLKQAVYKAIYQHQEEIFQLAESIANEPELGFKEVKTAQKVADLFEKYGVNYTVGHALTGVKGRLKGRSSKRSIAILGELDAIVCPDHPHADLTTGAAHACGHHAQIAAMCACAIGLATSGVMKELDGDVVFFAVPAEEFVELEYRNRLREQKKISYLSGKMELIHRGDFDDIDMAMMTHAAMNGESNRLVDIGGTSNGFVGKLIKFIGKEAHAAGAPHEGINALNAALIALTAIHAQRETFKDEDCVRFHPIITKGGDLVNVVPAEIRLESYVRAKTVTAILDANKKINRALQGGAMSIGAEVEIHDLPGYMPLTNSEKMSLIYERNVVDLLGKNATTSLGHNSGSTDMGNLSQLMPIIHPWAGGINGTVHTRDFNVSDPEMAYLITASLMTMTTIDLLADKAHGCEYILADFKPEMTKQEYLDFIESIK